MADTGEVIKGEVVPRDKAGKLASEMHGPSGLAMSDEERQVIYGGKDGKELEETDAYRDILNQILSAETPDAVLTPVEAHKIGEYIGVPLLLFGFSLQKSEYDVGAPFYAALQTRDVEKDEPVIITSGHRKILAQCVKLRQFVDAGKAEWPFQVMPCQRGVGAGGDPLYELGKWPQGYEPSGNPPF